MTQFSRRVRWLNVLFPASKAPQVRDPGSVSDDVSLVQQYDGGAWNFNNPSRWLQQEDSPVGATGDTDFFTVPEGEIYRMFSMHGFRLIAGNSNFQPQVADLTSVPNVITAIAPSISVPGGTGNAVPLLTNPVIIPAGLTLRVQHFQGDATTQNRYSIYGCFAPAGAVFSV